MIININLAYLNELSESEAADLYYGIVRNGHYLSCDFAALSLLNNSINQWGSKQQKSLVKTNQQNHLTSEIRKYLTTIQASQFTYDELMIIVTKPSCLLIENLPNESDVYRSIIGTYVGDTKYRNLFKKLEDAKNRGWLTFLHAGGVGEMKPLLDYYDKRDYKNVAEKKIGVLMDRDMNSGLQLPPRRQSLFNMLSGKPANAVTNTDIYTLSQGAYVWHLWFKRAIENYFPASQYNHLGYDTSTVSATPSDWSYKNLGGKNGTGIRGYKKNCLFNVCVGMSRLDYENNCNHFTVNGEVMSELQLFLLKLVKLI